MHGFLQEKLSRLLSQGHSFFRHYLMQMSSFPMFNRLLEKKKFVEVDQKKHQVPEQQHTEQEATFSMKPSPTRPLGTKKLVSPRANGGACGTPSRRLSLNAHQNGDKSGINEEKRNNSRLAAPINYVAMSKEDAASQASGTEPVLSFP